MVHGRLNVLRAGLSRARRLWLRCRLGLDFGLGTDDSVVGLGRVRLLLWRHPDTLRLP